MFWPKKDSEDSPRFKPRFSYAQVAMIDISESSDYFEGNSF